MAIVQLNITHNKRRLLIFEEENSLMQTIFSEVLIAENYQIKFVSRDGIDELERFFEPELILFDHVYAPIIKEDNFCRKIKEHFPDTPLMVISAYPLNDYKIYQNHIDLFIAKPFDLNHFLNCIDLCLQDKE